MIEITILRHLHLRRRLLRKMAMVAKSPNLFPVHQNPLMSNIKEIMVSINLLSGKFKSKKNKNDKKN